MPVCMYTYVYLFVEYPSDLSQCSFQRCNYILWPWTTVWSSRFHIFLQVFTQLCQPSHHRTTLHTQRLCMLTKSYDTAVVQSDTSPNFSSVVDRVKKFTACPLWVICATESWNMSYIHQSPRCWSSRSSWRTFTGVLSDFQHRLSGTWLSTNTPIWYQHL